MEMSTMSDDTDEQIAIAMKMIAAALRSLGTADANTPMGAIEMLSFEIKEGSERIARALHDIAEAIREHRA
jgi:hypothetical protein